MEKHKTTPPEDFKGGWDWDQKPVPPEVDFFDNKYDDSEHEDQDK